ALAVHGDAVIARGAREAVAAAPPQERALLVQGPHKPAADEVIRAEVAGWSLFKAGYATGRQFGGGTGQAIGDAQGVVYASVMTLSGLREHARLVEGSWGPAVMGAAAARVLGVKAGGTVPLIDRRTSLVTEVRIDGLFEPIRAEDAFWLLAPETARGSIGNTYGPIVMEDIAFESAAWVAQPDLTRATLDDLAAVRAHVQRLAGLPKRMGMGDGGQAYTTLDRLVERVQRADLVARSSLLTPMLLIIVLGGYTLVLLAGLLGERRRPEVALLKARGADRVQLARLAAGEGMLIALPAFAVVTPFSPWGAAAVGCVLAMVVPAVSHGPRASRPGPRRQRRSAAGPRDLLSRPPGRVNGASLLEARPSRATLIQRAGIDLLLVAFAGLAWLQLRQYSSPITGLGIDPLLASAAPLGVLAASVVALRLLPPLTGLGQRLIDRRHWFAAQLGMWQAGRRPHAGPVLLLALAVAVSTLAWALAGTAARSIVDQADHSAGADLRLSETSGFAPAERETAVAALPGVALAVPAWRNTVSLGEKSTASTLFAMDLEQAARVMRFRDGVPFADLVARRGNGVIPALASTKAFDVLHKEVGEEVRLPVGRNTVSVALLREVPSLPGTQGEPAILLDLPSLEGLSVQEWWIQTVPGSHADAAAAARQLPNLRVHDRIAMAQQAGQDPYGVGARQALFIAAFGAIALALVGVAVDVRATGRRRRDELDVLRALGASRRTLTRALATEQGFLAGLGVAVGVAVGIGVAASMAPLVILTPSAGRPDPLPVLSVDWRPVAATAVGILVLSVFLSRRMNR
ncbi:ABC transporter permease, partial [Allorhizocola rhizosphaerae]|uniref:ABC transporter permease n=1 Tax=Allorhizocola rhizosphaerae TaxID=1872709 RepID=UPI0013C2B70A